MPRPMTVDIYTNIVPKTGTGRKSQIFFSGGLRTRYACGRTAETIFSASGMHFGVAASTAVDRE